MHLLDTTILGELSRWVYPKVAGCGSRSADLYQEYMDLIVASFSDLVYQVDRVRMIKFPTKI